MADSLRAFSRQLSAVSLDRGAEQYRISNAELRISKWFSVPQTPFRGSASDLHHSTFIPDFSPPIPPWGGTRPQRNPSYSKDGGRQKVAQPGTSWLSRWPRAVEPGWAFAIFASSAVRCSGSLLIRYSTFIPEFSPPIPPWGGTRTPASSSFDQIRPPARCLLPAASCAVPAACFFTPVRGRTP